jgi:hypothetical protein
VRGIAGDSGQAAAEVSGPVKVGPVSADGSARVRLLMALPRHGQIRVAATLTCQLAEVTCCRDPLHNGRRFAATQHTGIPECTRKAPCTFSWCE